VDIKIDKLWKHFGIRTISLDVPAGQLLSIVGVNGSGKTSLLRCLAGLYHAESGDIYFDNEKFQRQRLDLRKRIHFIPDRPATVSRHSIAQHGNIVLSAYGLVGDEYAKAFVRNLSDFELAKKVHVPLCVLSRGQVYKVALALLFTIDPDLWLLDEPFASGMDAIGMDVFRRRAREATGRGKTIIYSTQILEIAESLSDCICVLSRGAVVKFGSIQEIKQGDQDLLSLLRAS
jgi:ABC-type multidrug transport system ATPase subunit